MDYSVDYSADPEAAIIDAKVIVKKILESDEREATLATDGIRRDDIKTVEKALNHIIRRNGFSYSAERDIVKEHDIKDWLQVKRSLQAMRYVLDGISDEEFLEKNEQDLAEIMDILNNRCGHSI